MGLHFIGNGRMVAWFAFVGACGCSAGPATETNEDVSRVSQQGSYDLVSRYLNPDSARGWTIEWKIPQLLNPASAWAVIGQWYNNLESGVYYNGSGWDVYYFGDDNGLAGNEASCDAQWGSGGICHGIFSNLQPGSQVVFKYEFCNAAHVASVSGTQNCLYVDLKDGVGYRFLAEDTNVRPEGAEMYAHDIENFRDLGYVVPQVSCANPTKMVRQQIKNAAGSWVTLTGASNWSFQPLSPYKFQNQKLSASPATWESCSKVTASVTVTSSWETGYCVNLTVSNSGPGAISSWNLLVDLNQSTMNNNFSANFSPYSGSRYLVTPLFWNSTIAAGGSQTVGFCGNKTGPNWTPIVASEDGF
jgi:hypothetical protein